MHAIAILSLGITLAAVTSGPIIAAPQHTLSRAEVNNAQWTGRRQSNAAVVLKAQVLLDRARISPARLTAGWGKIRARPCAPSGPYTT